MYYFKYFFITSVMGFIIESIIYRNFGGSSGILFGPWTVVYGFGTVIVLLLDKVIKKITKNKFFQVISLFALSALILTLLELLGGVLIEKIFNVVYWDYSNCKYNIGKYICVEMSLLWGFASLAIIYLFKPIIDIIIKYIPDFLVYILSVLIAIDFIITLLLKI